jgi:hypothetical protein
VGQLLGDDSTEGDAEHVDLVVAERLQQLLHGRRHATHPPRPPVGRGLPDTGGVEADRLHPEGAQLPLERLGKIQAGPQPGDQQQRRPLAAHRGAQPDPVGLDEPDLLLVR